jgi:DNA-binding IclR family transcriptional regulator
MSRNPARPARPPRRAAHRGAARVLDILEFLADARDDFTLAELSRRLRVPKSSLLALLRTFVERHYLEFEAGGYRLGPRAGQLGLRAAPERELSAAASPVLRELAERTGESAFLGVLASEAREVVYVDKVESRQRLRYTAELGERRPLHCSAPGLAVLAFLPEAERTRLLATIALRPFTKATLTDRSRLRTRLEEIRRAGVVVNVDEFIMGASGVAAPVLDRHGAARAACAVIGPTPRLLAHRDALARTVRAAGEKVSRALGYAPA